MLLAMHVTFKRACKILPLPAGRSDEDQLRLVLLNTETGKRKTLVSNVTRDEPRWSADGHCVQYEVRLPGIGFVRREIDVQTGDIRDLELTPSTVPQLPGFIAATEIWSPGRQWILYHHKSSQLCMARADGSQVFHLKASFSYFPDSMSWSPCGTKLAVSLTGNLDTGSYVVDLRTGKHRRLTPPLVDYLSPYSNYFIHNWSPDGKWISTTKCDWHNPRTYDYELNDVWLWASDGSESIPLTHDGRCKHGVIRPSETPCVQNGESELTLDWAKLIRGTRKTAGSVLAAQVRVDIEAGPPFEIQLMVQTQGGVIVPSIPDCSDIPSGFAKLDKFLTDNDYQTADNFTVVFPRYAFEDPAQDHTVRHVADLVFNETMNRGWLFDRDVNPQLTN
ncbi:MAG: hypothetical protein JWM11_7398 [Planctomycetaceae bacterium]|nr:hypothetical protein [Planctomycetaceae bacterium]